MSTQRHQFSGERLPHISEVLPISEGDEACLQELKDVLRKHGCLSRFGVLLLHEHFPISDDEVLVESCDPATRTLVSRPKKSQELSGVDAIETSWRLDTEETLAYCKSKCVGKGADHKHIHWQATK